MWFGYHLWIRPHHATLTRSGRGLLFLLVATLMGGFIGSPFWWTDQPWSFAWNLPPLASRMLAAAGWAFFAVTLLALHRPTYRRLRLMVLLIFVYLAPLGIAVLIYHLDRFDFGAPITYAFFAIAISMAVAATFYLLRQPQIIAEENRDRRRATVVVQVWLLIVAVICALWGIALFVTDNGPSELIWSWSGDLLTSRLIGVMLLTIAFGCLYSFRYAATARMMLVMVIVYTLGITIAAGWNAFFGLPIQTLYTSVFSVIFLITSVIYLSDRQPSQARIRTVL
jgi:hypothetical protein